MVEKVEPTKLCFVVGPIGTDESETRIHADWLLEMIIQPVMAGFPEFETKRADHITTPGMIDAQIINALLNADLVIADLSKDNPNAFYEIGIRHMAQKPIIHMQLVAENIPFDVQLYRAIKYSRARPADLRSAQNTLRAQVEAALAPDYQVENPVTRTRGVVQISEHATPAQQVLFDQFNAMQNEMKELRALVARSVQFGILPKRDYAAGDLAAALLGQKGIESPAGVGPAFLIDLNPSLPDDRIWEIIASINAIEPSALVLRNSLHTLQVTVPSRSTAQLQQTRSKLQKLEGIRNVLLWS